MKAVGFGAEKGARHSDLAQQCVTAGEESRRWSVVFIKTAAEALYSRRKGLSLGLLELDIIILTVLRSQSALGLEH